MLADAHRLPLPADLSIRTAAALRDECLAVDEQTSLIFDARDVARVDAAGLQFLAAFCRARGAGSWTWDAPTEVLCEGARILHLEACLAMPSSTPQSEEF